MLRAVGILLAIAVYIWFIIDVLRTPGTSTRTLPKFVWLLIVVLLPLLGGLIWLVAGRPRPERPRRGRRRRGPVAPDDDPAFLRQLDDDAWAERMKRRREDSGEAPA
ncbi:MAG: PLDc N-terminal domain-containing protein [Actinomycetales bacterium]|nr:PLDc N-terminal domain-containing protein [Actinomycetales bacterium]